MIEAAVAPPSMRSPPSKEAPIESLAASAYRIPTDKPEADGTYAWDATTLVLVEACGGGRTGLGYSYTDASVVSLISQLLFRAIEAYDGLDPPAAWRSMTAAVRNLGRDGLAATAISAVDTALWDLKAKILELPLALLFGRFRDRVPIYGS